MTSNQVLELEALLLDMTAAGRASTSTIGDEEWSALVDRGATFKPAQGSQVGLEAVREGVAVYIARDGFSRRFLIAA